MFTNLSIRQKLVLGFAAVAVLTSINAVFSYSQILRIEKPLKQEIPQSIEQIRKNSVLDALAQQIRYYDELLTQSARNYAFTGDKKWEDRYNSAVPELDQVIKEAIAQGDALDKQFFTSVDAANLALVELETEALALTDSKNNKQAVAILESKEYWDLKAVYSKGLEDYVKRKATEKDQTIQGSTDLLSSASEDTAGIISLTITLLIIISISVFVLALVFGYLLSRSILRTVTELIQTAREIAGGNLDKRAAVYSEDEIGALALTFNKMADSLKESRAALEVKTQALEEKTKMLDTRVEELEKPDELKVGRELKMVEMKKEIEDLRAENEQYKTRLSK